MLKKRRQQDTAPRERRPVASEGSQAVFSYHANRAARSESPRGPVQSVWANQPSPRPQHPGRHRRLRIIGVASLVCVLGLYSLWLDRSPVVIALADSHSRQVFLRPSEVYTEAAQAIMERSFANTTKLTIDTERVAQTMREQFPELEHVSVTLPIFGHRPAVYIQPAQPTLLLKATDGGVFVLDNLGTALINASQAPKVEKLGLPIIEDQSGLPVTLGKAALPSRDVSFIAEVVGQLKVKKITPTSIVLPASAASELDIRVPEKDYIIKFNLRGDARAEVGAYLAVKQHIEREQKVPTAYIDVRVDNRAYYK
jgi:hypothetical protein